MLADRSRISDWVARWERRVLPKMARGFEQTVPVHLTDRGSRQIDESFECLGLLHHHGLGHRQSPLLPVGQVNAAQQRL